MRKHNIASNSGFLRSFQSVLTLTLCSLAASLRGILLSTAQNAFQVGSISLRTVIDKKKVANGKVHRNTITPSREVQYQLKIQQNTMLCFCLCGCRTDETPSDHKSSCFFNRSVYISLRILSFQRATYWLLHVPLKRWTEFFLKKILNIDINNSTNGGATIVLCDAHQSIAFKIIYRMRYAEFKWGR